MLADSLKPLAYCNSVFQTASSPQPYPDWVASRPELRSVLSHMLRRNPMAALEMHVPAATLPPGTQQRALDDDEANASLIRAVGGPHSTAGTRRRFEGHAARGRVPCLRISGSTSRPHASPGKNRRATRACLFVCKQTRMHTHASAYAHARPHTHVHTHMKSRTEEVMVCHATWITLLSPAPPPQAEDQAETIISSRGGRVLGALTILKEDYFPGMKSHRLPQVG
jgi:hypothetical protein